MKTWIKILLVVVFVFSLVGCAPADSYNVPSSSPLDKSELTIVAQTLNTSLYKWTDGWQTCFFLENKDSGIATELQCK